MVPGAASVSLTGPGTGSFHPFARASEIVTVADDHLCSLVGSPSASEITRPWPALA